MSHIVDCEKNTRNHREIFFIKSMKLLTRLVAIDTKRGWYNRCTVAYVPLTSGVSASCISERNSQTEMTREMLRFAVTVATRATLSAGFGLAIHSREITSLGT